jgi:hypothetical protein
MGEIIAVHKASKVMCSTSCSEKISKKFKCAEIVEHSKFLAVVLTDLHSQVSRDSAVGIANGYGLHDRGVGVRVPVGSRISSNPRSPDRPWDPPNLLSNGYRGLFPRS